MFSMVCFPLRKRLKNSFDLLDTHYAAGEFPSAGVARSSNKVSWRKVFWFLTFSFRAEDAVNCGQAAELRNCHAKVDFEARVSFLNFMFYQEIGKTMLRVYLGMNGKTWDNWNNINIYSKMMKQTWFSFIRLRDFFQVSVSKTCTMWCSGGFEGLVWVFQRACNHTVYFWYSQLLNLLYKIHSI